MFSFDKTSNRAINPLPQGFFAVRGLKPIPGVVGSCRLAESPASQRELAGGPDRY